MHIYVYSHNALYIAFMQCTLFRQSNPQLHPNYSGLAHCNSLAFPYFIFINDYYGCGCFLSSILCILQTFYFLWIAIEYSTEVTAITKTIITAIIIIKINDTIIKAQSVNSIFYIHILICCDKNICDVLKYISISRMKKW